MLPWNVIIGTWVLNLLIKSPSTVPSQRARCADLGASLTGPGCFRARAWALWSRRTEERKTQMESRSEMCQGSVPKPDQADCLCVCGIHGSTLIWPVQLWLRRLNVALIYDFYPDNLCGILAYSRTAPVSWYSVSFLYIYMYISVSYLRLEDELMCSATSFTWASVSLYLYWARDKQGGHSSTLGSHYSKRHIVYCLWKDRIIQRNSYCQVFSA